MPELIQPTHERLHLFQAQFAQKLGVSIHHINPWENSRTRPLALKPIESRLSPMGTQGEHLRIKYFPQSDCKFYDI